MSRTPLDHLEQNQQSQGASLRPARLGSIAGQGTLQVLRNGSGDEVSIEGTWRPDKADAPIGPLLRAAADGEPVRFQGPLGDTTQPDADPVDLEVTIRSHGAYRFASASDVGRVKAGEERRFFNFQPAEKVHTTTT